MKTSARTTFLAAAVAVVCCMPAPAEGALVVDQSQLVNTDTIGAFSQVGLAQSFQQSNDNLAAVDLQLSGDGSGTADITIQLYDDPPNAGGILLGSATAFGAVPGALVHAEFPAPLPVVPDTTYFLVFTSTNSTFGIGGVTSDLYDRGHAFANNYQGFPGFDYAFQTYAQTAVVPEPAAWLLLALGGAGLMLLRRRR